MIKHKNISLIFLFICLKTFGQTPYYKMLGDTTRWYVSGYILGVKPSGNQSFAGIGSPCIGYYTAIKDSIYNGKTYKKFTKENSFSVFCLGFSSPPLNLALIREDSLFKKVYIVHPDSVNECVAMDFGMAVGDSIYLPFATNSYVMNNGYYKLDSIILKNEINGPRSHFFLSKYNAPINWQSNKKYFIEWIESIGATHFPINIIDEEQSMFGISSTCKNNQYTSFVTCKFTKGMKEYQDSCSIQYAQTHSDYILFGNNCEYYGFSGGINELSFINKVSLYPNPSSSEQLTLKFSATEFKPIDIIIYNMLGQKIYSEEIKISVSENEIHLNHLRLNHGLYNLQLKSANETIAIRFIHN